MFGPETFYLNLFDDRISTFPTLSYIYNPTNAV